MYTELGLIIDESEDHIHGYLHYQQVHCMVHEIKQIYSMQEQSSVLTPCH